MQLIQVKTKNVLVTIFFKYLFPDLVNIRLIISIFY
jgi:hypothetical protein